MRVPVVGKSYGSWKKQLRITRSWKVWHEISQNEVEKFWSNLERFNEVGKLPLKLKIYIDTRKGSLVGKGSWKTEKLERFKVW